MTPRHMVLAVAAVVVFGACVYLMFEVRRPAAAQAASSSPTEHKAATHQEPEGDPEDKPAKSHDVRPNTLRSPRPTSVAGTVIEPTPAPAVEDKDDKDSLDVKLDAVMAEANKAYDRLDFDEARAIAQKVLAKHPTNTRMLRIMVSAACIENDGPEAQKHYNKLPGPDREAMKTRCSKYGITFTDPPK